MDEIKLSLETEVIYHIDDDKPPYLIKIPLPSSLVTLKEFKMVLNKQSRNYKYFFKSVHANFGVVKEEIADDSTILPCFNGLVVSWLVTADGSHQSDKCSEMPRSEVDSRVGGGTSSRWDIFIHLLRQEISRPKKEVLDTIAERYFNGVDAAASSSDRAVNFYNLIKNLPSTSTKVILQHKLNLHINGPASIKTPNILTAIDETEEPFIIKILRTDNSIPYHMQRVEEKQEKETCILLGLKKPSVALCPVEVISITYEDRNYIALKMPRFLCTLQDNPKTFHHTIVSQGRRLIEAVRFMHDKDIVHMDIKADNIFIGVDKLWVLADFGSSKHIGDPITTSNLTNFVRYKLELAETELDWFMLLLVLLKESLEDRSNWISVICDKDEKYDPAAIDLYIRGLATNSPLQLILLELQDLARGSAH